MVGGFGKLCGTIKPNDDHVSNGSRTIKSSVVYFETQIGDQLPSLDSKNVQIWKITRDKEDDDVCNLEDDNEFSLEFTFDRSNRIEGFP